MATDLDIDLRNRAMILTDEQERAELAKVKLTYWPAEVRPLKDTESNIRGRIKGMFNVYCGQRLQGKFNTDLLRNILYQFRLYGVVVPQFLTTPIACFKDLEDAVAALPKATKYGQ
jgi:hypothetical protein